MKNKNIIYTVVFIFILLLTGCRKEHVHDYSIEWEWGEDVFAIFTCDCGPESTQKILASTKEEVIAEADCVNEGKVIVTAKAMFNNALYEKTEIVTVPKKGHDIVKHEAKGATCTEDGWKEYETCTRCDYTTYEEIKTDGHDLSTMVEKPGAVTNGYTVDVCSKCDYTYKYSYTAPILKLELIDDYYVVSGVNDNEISNIVIPETYNGIPLKKIELYAFENCTSLTNITIPDSVTSIESGAFYGCISLTNIMIPDSVTSIGSYAFENCASLTNIMIPDSVTSIGAYAFDGCTSITSINVSENNSYYKSIDGNLYSKDGKTLIQYAVGKKVTNFYIPDSVTSIGSYAFGNCTSLVSIEIPNSVTSIGGYAFENCTSLTNITIPDSVKSIESGAFYGCTSLTNIMIPDSVTSIGDRAFENCASLTNITIPDSVTSIEHYEFYGCTSLTNIMIPDSVTSIGVYAFYGCTSLTSINVSENNNYYKSIDGNLYSKDGKTLIQYAAGKKVTDFYIPDSVTSIGYGAIYGCTSLTNIMIPDSVTSIGVLLFSYCPNLTSINVSENNSYYKSIDGNLYSKDGKTLIQYAVGKKVTDFYIPDSVTSIGYGAFYGCASLTNITIPDSVTSIGTYAFYGCTSITSINVSENNSYYKSIDGNLYSKDGKTLIQYAVGKKVTNFYIPDSVTSIGSYAFYNCTSLVSIEIPNSVTSIGGYAFDNCTSLTNITIPDSVTSIGDYVFYNCTSLTNITIPDNVTSIGVYAFYNCTSLTNITIPDSVTSIEFGAFYGCTSLKSIIIPNSVTNIEISAFRDCSNLTIYCESTSKPSGWHFQWNVTNCPVVWGYE